ncbi:DUF6480 family protein [Cellulomonas carbonis]|uniref:Uncharacterized protein n=1 Tax=Cellulomonas carbonis T26 TaxID=947969 RepID=A0A0A0BLL2_9CELL|nr:DUF6480 family protein [Cellulomonas carbonis]KGM08720.1 hypothetical protein N868_06740 [Cellulomonas carbonis T26]MDT0165489.1 DUF6480 family protein [Actinotalea sp. AC32]GGC17226.1 hypothetical protein GCM10010972_33120 [Cellulomonas carbonis]
MTTSNPDPDPSETTGLEPGGSVAPGDTPPGEASTTSGVTTHQPDLPSERTNKAVYGVVVALGLLVVVMLVAYAAGAFG